MIEWNIATVIAGIGLSLAAGVGAAAGIEAARRHIRRTWGSQ